MIKGSVFKRAISLLLTFTVLFATVLSTGISVDAQTVVSDGINNYETLAEAVASVAEGSELYLTSDIVLDDSLTVSKSVVIRSDYGHTITRSETFDGSMIELNGGTLTVAGITLDGEGKEASAPLVTVNSGTFRMLSGTLTGNNNVNEGGSALRLNGGTFDFSAGTISSNKCAGNGNAVYVAGGRFELSGYASFGASSDIYLSVSSVIYITDSLGSSVDTVNVSMSDLSVGRTVAELSYGVELTEEQISRFKISGSDEHLVTLFDGKLVVTSSGEPQPEIKDAVEYNGKKFDTLSDAMEAVEGNEAELVILKDTVINETVFIPASMKVSVVPKDGAVISRGADFKDTLFSVSGTLVLKGTMQINGSASAEADAPAFKVDGALELGNSVIISNHNNTTSTVSINGGKVTMTGGSISGNMASNGAVGIFGGSFVMKGGSISTNTTVNGGGVYIGKNSSFDMQGGRIYDNSASLGSCVYNAGTLTLSGDATLLSRNNSIAMIYLDAYTLVNVAAGWTPSVVNGYANVISVGMKTYNINTEVVSFADAAREDAFILAGAPEKLVLKVKDSTKLIIASEDGDIAYFNNKGYPTLEEAFAAVPENGAGTVYLVGDAEVAATIVIKQGQNVVLSVTDDPVVQADYTQRRVIRKGEFADVIFNVEKGATLTFGAPAEKNLVIDGELKSVNNSAVIVSGVFNLEAGASVVNNNFNKVENIDGKLMTLGGGIRVEKGGVFMLSGGTVSGCYASFGGGIYVNDGTLNISNGNITSNSALIGGGVYLHTEKTAAPVQENAPASDETVQSYRALLNMTGGSVSLNKATENKKITGAGIGGGIFVGNGSYTILSGGKLFNNTALKGAGVGVGSAPENADDDPVPSDFIINDKMFIAEKDSVYLAYPELSVITMTETKLSEQKTPILLEIPDFMPQNMPLIHYVKELPLAYEEETESGETETKPSDKKEEEEELTAAPLLEKEIFKFNEELSKLFVLELSEKDPSYIVNTTEDGSFNGIEKGSKFNGIQRYEEQADDNSETTEEEKTEETEEKKPVQIEYKPVKIAEKGKFSVQYEMSYYYDLYDKVETVITAPFAPGTYITLVDYTIPELPIYYYYKVTGEETVVKEKIEYITEEESEEILYTPNIIEIPLSAFAKLGSKSEFYEPVYDADLDTVTERMLFVVDFTYTELPEGVVPYGEFTMEWNHYISTGTEGVRYDMSSHIGYVSYSVAEAGETEVFIEAEGDKVTVSYSLGTNSSAVLSNSGVIVLRIGSRFPAGTYFTDSDGNVYLAATRSATAVIPMPLDSKGNVVKSTSVELTCRNYYGSTVSEDIFAIVCASNDGAHYNSLLSGDAKSSLAALDLSSKDRYAILVTDDKGEKPYYDGITQLSDSAFLEMNVKAIKNKKDAKTFTIFLQKKTDKGYEECALSELFQIKDKKAEKVVLDTGKVSLELVANLEALLGDEFRVGFSVGDMTEYVKVDISDDR